MTIKQAIEILSMHQKWRLGETHEGPTTRDLTQAINTILKHYDNL